MECSTDRIIVLGEYVGTGYGKTYESTRRVYDEGGDRSVHRWKDLEGCDPCDGER